MKTSTRFGLGVSALAALLAWVAARSRRPAAAAPVGEPTPARSWVDRRGPNRATNVVRPAFGRRSSAALPPRAKEAGGWEAF